MGKAYKYKFITHQENMSVKCIPPHTPLLYSKTGVNRGMYIFLNFAPKHRLWVLARQRGGSKAEAVLTCTHNLCLEQK